MSKVSVVTGANKGIGFAIVRVLCKKFGGTVILTSRNEERGLDAVDKLKEEGLTATFEQLDITDSKSVEQFVENLRTKYGGVDVLCNNAGIAFKMDSTSPSLEKAKVTGETNFISTVKLTTAVLPLMKEDGRICQVSSRAGLLSLVFPDKDNPVRKRLLDPNLTEEDLFGIYQDYIKAVEKNDYSVFKNDAAYSMSKCLLTTHTRVLAGKLKDDPRRIIVNSCCPGYVNTDMTSGKGFLSVDEGASTPLMLCELPNDFPSGKFYADGKLYDWENKTLTSFMLSFLYPPTLLRLISHSIRRMFS